MYTKSRNVFIVNYKNEEIVKRILPFGERCYCTIALSPEGKYLAVSTTNQIVEGGYQIEIFDTNTLQVVKTIENLGSQALEMYFSQSKSQPQLVVSRNNSQELQLHDLFGRRPIINFSGISRPKMVVFSRDNNLMAAVNDNTGAVSIFDVRNGQLLIRTPKRYELIHDVVFSRDGKKLFVAGSISGGQDTLRLDAWDLENNDNLFATRLRDRGDGSALVFHPVDPVMGVSTDDYSIVDIIDRSNGHFISSFDADPDGKLGLIGASGLAFTPDGRYLIATHWSHLVSVWEYNSRRLLWQGSNISSPLDKQVWPQKGKLPSISNFSLLVRQISGNLNSIGGKTNVNSNGSVSVHWTQSECIITIKRQGDDTIDKVIIPIHLDEECSQIEALSINTEGTKLAVGFISDETGLFSAPKILILDFSPYITKLACGFTVNCSRWRVIKKLSAIDQIDDIKFSKSGMFLAVRDSSGQITVFDGIKFIPYRTFSGIEGSTFPSPPSLVFSDDDHWLATGFGQFGGPMRWRLDGAEIINTVEGKMPNWLH